MTDVFARTIQDNTKQPQNNCIDENKKFYDAKKYQSLFHLLNYESFDRTMLQSY